MDYTQSNSFDTHAATGNRMHEDSKAVPTAISDADLNGPVWELLSLIKQAGISPAGFDANTPATYQQVAAAIAVLQRQQTNTAYTTAGTAPAFTVTLPASAVALAALGANLRLRLNFHAAGAGSDTLNIAGLGAKILKQYDSNGAKVAAVITSGQLVDVEYDGTDFVVLNPLSVVVSSPANLYVTDINNLVKSGFYRIGNTETNRPGDYGQILVMRGGGDSITQIYGDYATGNLLTRSGSPPSVGGIGGWTAWKTVATTSDLAGYATTTALAGYATTTALAGKANSATTLAGYGITDASKFGVGQTKQNMTASRALGTTYTNMTSNVITVSGYCTNVNNGVLAVVVAGLTGWYYQAATGAPAMPFYAEVGPCETYVVSVQSGSLSLTNWVERR
jgi:hypothetical protein